MDRIRHAICSRRLDNFWGGRKILMAVSAFVVVVIAISLYPLGSGGCRIPAIYNFGDSNSDTGSGSSAFSRVPPPFGETFFGKPSGRVSDGRLIIDFIATKLGLPFLRSYVDAIAPDFRHGANVATNGATARPATGKSFDNNFSPFSLDIQLNQFKQLKARTIELYNQDKSLWTKRNLPTPSDFPKAIYTLDIGQNDLHLGFLTTTEDQVLASIPHIINQLALSLKELYQEGARMFWIHNTGPIGCLPVLVINNPPKPDNVDSVGCVKSYNEIAQEFNKELKDKVSELRTQFHDALLILIDVFSVKYTLISQADKHGFEDPLGYCCGRLGDNPVACGRTAIINGTEVHGISCPDPSKYISWDDTHYSEAANHWVADSILDGSFSDPKIPINKACQKLTVSG